MVQMEFLVLGQTLNFGMDMLIPQLWRLHIQSLSPELWYSLRIQDWNKLVQFQVILHLVVPIQQLIQESNLLLFQLSLTFLTNWATSVLVLCIKQMEQIQVNISPLCKLNIQLSFLQVSRVLAYLPVFTNRLSIYSNISHKPK